MKICCVIVQRNPFFNYLSKSEWINLQYPVSHGSRGPSYSSTLYLTLALNFPFDKPDSDPISHSFDSSIGATRVPQFSRIFVELYLAPSSQGLSSSTAADLGILGWAERRYDPRSQVPSLGVLGVPRVKQMNPVMALQSIANFNINPGTVHLFLLLLISVSLGHTNYAPRSSKSPKWT